MKLQKFKNKYRAAAKLDKIVILADNAVDLIKSHPEEFLQYASAAHQLFSQYLEFQPKPEQRIANAVLIIKTSLLKWQASTISDEDLQQSIAEIEQFMLLIESSIMQAEFYATLCYVMLIKNRNKQAIEYGKKAHNLIGSQKLTPRLKFFYSNYGLALIYSSLFDEAKAILTLGLARNHDQDKLVSEKLHLHLGLLYRNQNFPSQALEEFLTARKLHDKDDISGTVIINIDIASIYVLSGDYKHAIEYVKLNFPLVEKYELDPSAQSNFIQSLNLFISCAITIQDFDESQLGIELFEHYMNKYQLLSFMEEYYRLAADNACAKGDIKKAETLYDKACTPGFLKQPVSIFFMQSYANFLIYIDKPEKALQICDQTLPKITHNSINESQLYLYDIKIAAFKKLNRYREAFELLEEVTRYKEELKNSDLKSQIDSLIKKNEKQQKQLRDKEKRISLFSENFSREHNINFVGTSKAIKEVLEKATIAAQHPEINVLINGESGTGKELIARYIHYASTVDKTIFQEVNCSAIPDTMLESEFFGYKKGAFTGADYDRKGFIAAAHTGTLFLDEIGDLPLQLQPKLLKVLEEKTFTPLGSNSAQKANFRLISATNKDLGQMTAQGEFRADLFNRINSLVITIPPLRKRKADIIALSDYFLTSFTRDFNMLKPEIDQQAKDLLLSYSYPGNVRELRNIIERSMIFVRQGQDFTTALQKHGFIFLQTEEQPAAIAKEALFSTNTYNLQEIEKQLILQALNVTGNRKNKAAVLLGITPSSLTRRLIKYKINT